MNNSTIVFLINDDVRAIKATYEDGKPAEIFKTMDQNLAVDDLAVVTTSTRHEMTVVKVTEVDLELDLDTTSIIRWVVTAINQSAFAEVLAQEEEAIATVRSAERARKKKALRDAIFADHADKMEALKLANHSDDDGLTD